MATGLLLTAVVATTSGCASMAPRLEPGHVGYFASAASDVISTRQALAAGAQEVNPLLGESPDTAKLIGLKTAGWFVFRGLENALADSVGRELRWYEKLLFWAIPTGLAAWASSHNFALAEELNRTGGR